MDNMNYGMGWEGVFSEPLFWTPELGGTGKWEVIDARGTFFFITLAHSLCFFCFSLSLFFRFFFLNPNVSSLDLIQMFFACLIRSHDVGCRCLLCLFFFFQPTYLLSLVAVSTMIFRRVNE